MGSLGADPANPGRMIVAVEGGAFDREGITTDAIVFSISPDGLEAMLDDLHVALQTHRENRPIDMRYLT